MAPLLVPKCHNIARLSSSGSNPRFSNTKDRVRHAQEPIVVGSGNGTDEESSGGSSSNENDDLSVTLKPHTKLLTSLNAHSYPDAPPNKRRRIGRNAPRCQSHVKAPVSQNTQALLEVQSDQDENSEDEDGDRGPDASDPYSTHFIDGAGGDISPKIEALEASCWAVGHALEYDNWSCTLKIPGRMESAGNQPAMQTVASIGGSWLNKKLRESASSLLTNLGPLCRQLASDIFQYRDLLFPLRTPQSAEHLRQLASLHFLNHVFKTRNRVLKNNALLARQSSHTDVEVRDQGFTRPKVLLLVPTRQSCVKYIDALVYLCAPEQQENRKRFQETFSATASKPSADKPEDFCELFAGNDDDMFRLGVKFTRKTMKLFSKFYSSDIIIASPLGLRLALSGGDRRKNDHDFLSSLEVLVIDQADAINMQNWEHIDFIFEHLNLQPQEAHGCDFSRVRNWYLDGHARFFRQTIIFSSYNFAAANKLYASHMLNHGGKCKFDAQKDGMMAQMSIMPLQTFSRFGFRNITTEPDDRFEFFSKAVLPAMAKALKQDQGQSGLLLLLPSYADFLRVRNYMASEPAAQDISFGAISEYTSVKDVARARSHFLSGRYSILLYTERAHHFRRYHIKGVKRIVMYGLPENPVFYRELVEGYLGANIAAGKTSSRDTSVRVLFSRLDILKLERIVGTQRYLSMLNWKKDDTYDFTA